MWKGGNRMFKIYEIMYSKKELEFIIWECKSVEEIFETCAIIRDVYVNTDNGNPEILDYVQNVSLTKIAHL